MGYKINDVYRTRLTKSAEIFEREAVTVYSPLCHAGTASVSIAVACRLVVSVSSQPPAPLTTDNFVLNFPALHYGFKSQIKAK